MCVCVGMGNSLCVCVYECLWELFKGNVSVGMICVCVYVFGSVCVCVFEGLSVWLFV